ncbi:hypothetical protein VTJ49DRAFT_5631 [Mycothermus thermophilus]|uniref:Uncharacterized protein n=1 Tax=Humicola insolens TaxID=85995 RepID=A0ABR3V2U3_HUMIN
MYARAAPGDQAGAALEGHDGRPLRSQTWRTPPSAHHLPPFSSTTNDSASSRHPDEQDDDMLPPRPPPTPPPAREAPTPGSSASSPEIPSVPISGRTVEKLARKLSRQDLYHSNSSSHHRYRSPQRRPQSSWRHYSPETVEGQYLAPLPAPSSMSSMSSMRPLRSFRSWAGPELSYASVSPASSSSFWLLSSSSRSSSSSHRNSSSPWPHVPPIGLDQPIEVDEAYLSKPSSSADAGNAMEADEAYVPGAPIEVDEAYLGVSGPTISESIEVDQAYATAATTATVAAEKPPSGDRKLLDVVKRVRRQPSGPLKRSRSSSRPLNPRVEGMIANETQCTVRSASPLSSTKTTTTSGTATSHQPPPPPPAITTTATTTPAPISPIPPSIEPSIEPDPSFSMPSPDSGLGLDADSTMPDADDPANLPTILARAATDLGADGTLPSRYACEPDGVRKYAVAGSPGVTLRYRLSIDAALRCQNVVKNRPRMRKRHKSDRSGKYGSDRRSVVSSSASWCGSSEVGSAVHSPC